MRANTTTNFWDKIEKSAYCWEWRKCTNKDGYGEICYQGKVWKAHRLAFTLTFGIIPQGLRVLHRCDNPPCCNPDHLFLGTQADNVADMVSKSRNFSPKGDESGARLHPEARARGNTHGRSTRPERTAHGSGHGRTHLNEEDVKNIRQRYAQGGVTQTQLAHEYRVGQSRISAIVLGVTWKHVA